MIKMSQKSKIEFMDYMIDEINIMRQVYKEFEDIEDVASTIKYKMKDYMEELDD